MQLLYLWIEEYKNIRQQGFHFSPDYRFDYDHKSQTLTVEEGKPLPKNFFGENISSVTAIVGENGSGKSTVLEFLTEYAFNIVESKIRKHPENNNILISVKTSGVGYFIIYDLKNSFKADKMNNIKIKWDMECADVSELIGYSVPTIMYSSAANFTKYNNRNPKNLPFLRDISAFSILHSLASNFSQFANLEILKIINLIQKIQDRSIIPFKLPKAIFISFPRICMECTCDPKPKEKIIIDELNYQSFLSSNDTSLLISTFESFKCNKSFKIDKSEANDWISEAKNEAKIAIFAYYINSILAFLDLSPEKFTFGSGIKFIPNKKTSLIQRLAILKKFINKLIKYATKEFNKKLIEQKQHVERTKKNRQQRHFFEEAKIYDYENNLESFSSIEKDITFLFSCLDKNFEITSEIKISTENSQELFTLFKNLSIISRADIPSYKYKWQGISGGEESILLLLSRIFNNWDSLSKKNLLKNAHLTSYYTPNYYPPAVVPNWYLLLDEPDAFLHPQWQKELVSKILPFMDWLMKEYVPDKKIQIILTTHSPFLLSDIPRESVIFLKKDEDGNCEIVDRALTDNKQTFAANIHSLFADDFFLKGALIGDFAKGKINEVIKLLTDSSKQLSDEEMAYCRQIIEMIGEPIMRNKLTKMFDAATHFSTQDKIKNIEAQIQKLQQEMINLKNLPPQA